jgi:phosphate transport system protein
MGGRISGYDKILFDIRSMVAGLSESSLRYTQKSIETLKVSVNEDWRAMDDDIDQARDQIVNCCYDIMCLQQLRREDLRWILGYQRIARELERIADYACDIAEFSDLKPVNGWPEVIFDMVDRLITMLEYNVALLRGESVFGYDLESVNKVLDQTHFQLKKQLLDASSRNEPRHDLGVTLLIARTLERMGDHAVNVEQELFYVQTGKKRLKEV